MANEPGPGDMHEAWRSQPLDAVRMSADEVRRRYLACAARARWAFWVAVSLSASSAALCAWFFYQLPYAVPRIGFVLTFAGELYFVYQFLRLRREGAEQAMATVAACRAQLVRQRELVLSVWWKFLLPFVPGVGLVMLGFLIPELGAIRAVAVTSAYLALPFLLAVPVARRKARRLGREIAELDSDMR